MAWAPLAMTAASFIMNQMSKGEKEELEPVPTKSPQQEKFAAGLIDMLNKMKGAQGGYSQAENYYNKFLGPDRPKAFAEFSSPYLQQFQEKILPMIAERFGGVGALSSSGFGQALGGASSDLQSNLAQLFSSLQSQAAGQNYNQFNQLTQQGLGFDPFAYHQQPGGGTQGGGFMQGLFSNPQFLSGMAGMFSGGGGGGGGSSLPNFQSSSSGVGPGTSGNYNLPTFLGR